MRNGEGGTVPSYNVQLITDTTHGLVVNVEATTDAIDYRQLEPALNRCQETLGRLPKQMVADGDYTNHASVQAAAASGSTSMVPGKIAGNRPNMTPMAAVERLSVARFLTMLSTMSTFVRLANDSLFML